jgi:hypothetical protein
MIIPSPSVTLRATLLYPFLRVYYVFFIQISTACIGPVYYLSLIAKFACYTVCLDPPLIIQQLCSATHELRVRTPVPRRMQGPVVSNLAGSSPPLFASVPADSLPFDA